jgi:hypothetical protein
VAGAACGRDLRRQWHGLSQQTLARYAGCHLLWVCHMFSLSAFDAIKLDVAVSQRVSMARQQPLQLVMPLRKVAGAACGLGWHQQWLEHPQQVIARYAKLVCGRSTHWHIVRRVQSQWGWAGLALAAAAASPANCGQVGKASGGADAF